MTAQQQSYKTGVIYVLMAEFGWSLSGIFVRLMPGLDGWQINCWRGFWTGVFLLVILVALYGRETIAKFRLIPWVALVASAGFFAAGSTLYVTSLTLVSTATVSVIGATSPIFAGLLSPWVTGEKPGLTAWLSAALALSGVSIIAWEQLSVGNLIGIIICVGVPISFAGQTLSLRRYRNIDMVPAICVGGFLSFFAAGLLGFTAGHAAGGFEVSLRNVSLLCAMGLLQLAVPLLFYARGARSVPAVTLTLIVMLDAVLNPLWPWLVLGETPSQSDFIGGSIIIGAVMISIFGGRWIGRGARAAAG
jgi:drug/metabolite transporter (DMT)-like permease